MVDKFDVLIATSGDTRKRIAQTRKLKEIIINNSYLLKSLHSNMEARIKERDQFRLTNPRASR